MILSTDQMMQLAERARLELSEAEAEAYAEDLGDLERMSSALLPFFGALGDIEDEPVGLSGLREDAVKESLSRERLLSLSSLREADCIAVPCAVKEV